MDYFVQISTPTFNAQVSQPAFQVQIAQGAQGPQGPPGTITDGDKGDITVSGGGTVWSIITVLKNAWDAAAAWVTANGTAVVAHLTDYANPHQVTKTQVGLGNVDNTSDANKPISTATQTALDAKQSIIYPAVARPDFYYIEDFTGFSFSPFLNVATTLGSLSIDVTDVPYIGARSLNLATAAGHTTLQAGGVIHNATVPGAIYRIKHRFKMPAVTGSDVINAISGFARGSATIDAGFGAYFLLTQNSSGITVQCRSVSSSSAEVTNVASVSAGVYNVFEVVMAYTSVQFWVNGVLVATHTSIIPTGGSGTLCTARLTVYNSATTSVARSLVVDYFALHYTF